MYEKEGYFYEQLASQVQKTIAVPHSQGVIRTPAPGEASKLTRVGIILEDLRERRGVFNCDLTVDICMLLKVVTCAFDLHYKYYFRSPFEVMGLMKELVVASDIAYYQTLVRNRFEIFITRNSLFMTEDNQIICKEIARHYPDIAAQLSSFPLSFCHGDMKSPNIFYEFTVNASLGLHQPAGEVVNRPGVGTEMNAKPVFLDWQYIHLNKGVSDIAFL